MKIKTPNIEFISFSDGVCDIYAEDDEGAKISKYESLGFSNKTLGFNRYYAGKAANIEVNRVVKIPNISNIDNHDIVEISGVGKFSIELIQFKDDTNPLSKDLTLRKLEAFGVM